jgi:hypothetical protein
MVWLHAIFAIGILSPIALVGAKFETNLLKSRERDDERLIRSHPEARPVLRSSLKMKQDRHGKYMD